MKLQLLTLAGDIFKLSTGKSFSHKALLKYHKYKPLQMQGLGQFWFWYNFGPISFRLLNDEESTYKEVSRSLKLKCYNLQSILMLSCKMLSNAVLDLPFGRIATTRKHQYQRANIDLCGCYHPNCFAILVPVMGLF